MASGGLLESSHLVILELITAKDKIGEHLPHLHLEQAQELLKNAKVDLII